MDNIEKKKVTDIEHDLYDVGKCKFISKEMKEHLIMNGMLHLVVKHPTLFEK